MKEQIKILKKHILTGTSHMIPFIVAGGILFSISVMLNPAGAATPTEGWLAGLAQIGLGGLTLFVPVLGGYIAYSIADKPRSGPWYDRSLSCQFHGRRLPRRNGGRSDCRCCGKTVKED